MARKSPITPK
jgi:hypothetical protein